MTARTTPALRRAAAGTTRPGPLAQYALLAGPLLSMLDSSIMNVAVEPIARELHTSLTTVQWTVSGYLLALGAGLAGTAYLARRFGTRPVYRGHGPVAALHSVGLILTGLAVAGILAATALRG